MINIKNRQYGNLREFFGEEKHFSALAHDFGKVSVKSPGGGVLPQILDRGVPRRFLNPNPI